MATGVVTVGRRQYASGLYWENSPSGRISQAAKEAARQPSVRAAYYAARAGNKQGRVPQFGLAPETPGLKSDMPSLAGCLANQQPGSWIGAFRLREGVSLVIVRDDLIVPDGDLFFNDETEARDHLYQEMGVGGFQRTYAPDSWGVPGADTMPLALLLNDKTDIRLRSVELSKAAKIGFLIGTVVVLLIVAGSWWYQADKAKQAELRRQQMEALERMRRAKSPLDPFGGGPPEYPKPVRKWENEPRPLEIIEACRKALEKVSTRIAGWRTDSHKCTPGTLTVRWARSTGNAAPPPDSLVNDSANSATRSVSLGLSKRGPEDLVDPDVITQRYLNQNWGANHSKGRLKRLPDDPLPKPPPNYKGEWNPPPPPWVKRSFTIEVQTLPGQSTYYLEGIPGLTISSISYRGAGLAVNGTWAIEGVIYENRR
ncbi:MAG: type 4b pilus protein PilO2 [Alphaproteobacteria bacterium]|nr:type 4b pilus protein PilO2 [Alphaproteobacteria bacterium]